MRCCAVLAGRAFLWFLYVFVNDELFRSTVVGQLARSGMVFDGAGTAPSLVFVFL